jgi:hypothetical protein
VIFLDGLWRRRLTDWINRVQMLRIEKCDAVDKLSAKNDEAEMEALGRAVARHRFAMTNSQ